MLKCIYDVIRHNTLIHKFIHQSLGCFKYTNFNCEQFIILTFIEMWFELSYKYVGIKIDKFTEFLLLFALWSTFKFL